MGLFSRKKTLSPLDVDDDFIGAPLDSTLKDAATLPDPMFAQKMLGESTALTTEERKATVCAPANGNLTVVYPTGHAFGVRMKDGTSLLVHIGIDTVNAKGDGFKLLKKQGEDVRCGEPVVEVDFAKLKKQYDMSVILILTENPAGHDLKFRTSGMISRGESIVA